MKQIISKSFMIILAVLSIASSVWARSGKSTTEPITNSPIFAPETISLAWPCWIPVAENLPRGVKPVLYLNRNDQSIARDNYQGGTYIVDLARHQALAFKSVPSTNQNDAAVQISIRGTTRWEMAGPTVAVTSVSQSQVTQACAKLDASDSSWATFPAKLSPGTRLQYSYQYRKCFSNVQRVIPTPGKDIPVSYGEPKCMDEAAGTITNGTDALDFQFL